MKNVYNVRNDENLIWVLDEDNTKHVMSNEKIATLVYLYYEEDVSYYCDMLKNIPAEIDVYIISSGQQVLESAKSRLSSFQIRNVVYILKENRGRDISALLVACAKVFEEYEYVCFLHDKKTKTIVSEEEGRLWIENLWTNMIDSKEYIYNVIKKFKENSELGLLVPPEPVGEYYSTWYRSGWTINFENTLELANHLGLICDISKECPPITYGTVFWCRTDAIRKLFKKGWKYEDFPMEPLPDDGTISHAIERILGYVAQDAGYKTGTIMTKNYAAKQMMIVQEQMRDTYNFIEERIGIKSIRELKYVDTNWNKLKEIFAENSKVYMYGAGITAKRYLKVLNVLSCKPVGVIVTKYKNACRELEGIPIVEIETLSERKDITIIVAASGKNKEEIINTLQRYKFEKVVSFF